MYQNYSREALIELIDHQKKLIDYSSQPFLTKPPIIVCPKDISKASYFIELFANTLKASIAFDKEVDINEWLSKKDYHNISDADFFYHLAFNSHPAFNKAANDIITPYINKANADNKSYSDILHFCDTCLEQTQINESVVSRLLDNIKKISNHKERDFFEKYLRDSIIKAPDHHIFVKLHQNNHDILNLKKHPESLVFFSFTRQIINGFIDDFRSSSIHNLNEIIKAVVKTGVFDKDIFDAYHHKNTLMEGTAINVFKKSLSLRKTIDDENALILDNALLERLELITSNTKP